MDENCLEQGLEGATYCLGLPWGTLQMKTLHKYRKHLVHYMHVWFTISGRAFEQLEYIWEQFVYHS